MRRWQFAAILLLLACWALPGSPPRRPTPKIPRQGPGRRCCQRLDRRRACPEGRSARFRPGDSRHGPIRQGEGRRVLVKNAGGKEVVAHVHVDVGDRRLVTMPDGRMASFPIDDTQATKQPFQPATQDEIAKVLTANTFAGFRTKSTRHYLYIYNTSKEFHTATSRILETIYPALLAYFKRRISRSRSGDADGRHHVPDRGRVPGYHAMPPGVVAYYSNVSNHVVVYEQGKLNQLGRSWPNSRPSPRSPTRGSTKSCTASACSSGCRTRRTGSAKGWPNTSPLPPPTSGCLERVGKINDMRMLELHRYLKYRESEPGSMVEHTVSAAGSTSTGYATAWALTHYLAARKKEKFFAYLTDVSRAQPLADGLAADLSDQPLDNRDVFIKHFGATSPPWKPT